MAAKQKQSPRNVVRQTSNSRKAFYPILGLIALAGAGTLAYTMMRNSEAPVSTPIVIDPATVGNAQPYTLGKADAPVTIMEFADFECPGCAQYATVTGPDVKARIVDAGLAKLEYYDFPLPQHRNSQPAHNAAACANDQGKFWEMHDRLFAGQNEWNTQNTSNPKPVFQRYAREIGLNAGTWESCYDARRHQKRIEANFAEGERRRVQSTPTFIVGNRMYPGGMSYDQMKRLVDSLAAQ